MFEGKVTYANLPAHDGQLGVMSNRAPLLTKLGIGSLRLTGEDGTARVFVLKSGFAQMLNNRLILLCEQAADVKQVVVADIKASIDEANGKTPDTKQEAQRIADDITFANKILEATGNAA